MKYFLALLHILHIHISVINQSPQIEHFKPSQLPIFVAWNVGQGQWVTYVNKNICHHFDLGGEKMDWKSLESLCQNKLNFLYFSHWDQDHISFTSKVHQHLNSLCLMRAPQGPNKNSHKVHMLKSIPDCLQSHLNLEIEEIFNGLRERFKKKKDSNSFSRVFELQNEILIPGDSPQTEEVYWKDSITRAWSIRVLVLGHHGSHTSTTDELLNKLKNLKMSISTSRFKKYGHPHQETLKKLKAHGVPCLRTEYWGNLIIEL